jgi:hypothetical protein
MASMSRRPWRTRLRERQEEGGAGVV